MNYKLINTRDDFHLIINEHGFERAVEVGVGLGLNAIYLLDNSNLKHLTGVDNWCVRNPRKNQDKTKNKLDTYGDRYRLIELDSVVTADQFEDGSLDYVYIDGDHGYKGAYNDFVAWYPKVRVGGFFGGHDYITCKKCEVEKAVDQFFSEIGRTFNITNEANDGRVNKSFWIIK